MINYEKIYKQYLFNQDKVVFTKEEVVERLKKKFKAIEFSKEEILDLVRDDHFEYSKIYTCLCINDPSILLKLYSAEEKRNHREELLDNRENPLDPKKVKKGHWAYNHMLLDEQEGRRLDIILESKDGKYISESQVR